MCSTVPGSKINLCNYYLYVYVKHVVTEGVPVSWRTDGGKRTAFEGSVLALAGP